WMPGGVVAGLEPLGVAIAERLVQAGAEVRAISGPGDGPGALPELERLGVRAIAGSPRTARALEAAGLASASALVLAADNDAENVDAALLIRRLRPDLPLVVRLFDPDLTTYLHDTLPRVTVLSMSGLSAPVLADLALRALAEREAAPVVPRPSRPAGAPGPRRALPVDRVLARILAAFVLIVVASAAFFAHSLNLRLLDALYFVWTTVTTVGYGDIALRDASDLAK